MNPFFRPVRPSDVPQVVAIEKDCFPDPWDPSVFETLASGDGQVETERGDILTMHVVAENAEIVGYVVWQEGWRGHEGHILNIAVKQEHRGRKLGKSLLLYAFDIMKSHGVKVCKLETWESNHAARRLYESLGMMPAGRRTAYYGNEDAVLYSIRLDH